MKKSIIKLIANIVGIIAGVVAIKYFVFNFLHNKVGAFFKPVKK